jgi:predicted methyltransferase
MFAWNRWLPLAALLFATIASAAKTPTPYDEAVRDPARSAKDRERDAHEHPAALFEFMQIKPGMAVADVFGGGGYYSELIAHVVGAEGRTLLVNNPAYQNFAKEDLKARFADGRLPRVTRMTVETCDLKLGQGELDAILIVMSYHDLYYADPDSGWPAIDAEHFLDQIHRALKPGGVFVIVDHAAVDGSGTKAAQDLHRIDEAFAKRDIVGHGFVFEENLDLLRNADDPRTQLVFDKTIRGKTDRFIHRYRKPAD